MSTIELIAIAKHIAKRYGSVKAADAVEPHLEEGELVTVPGPSGSGKTTLLILIAGLAPPSAGSPERRAQARVRAAW